MLQSFQLKVTITNFWQKKSSMKDDLNPVNATGLFVAIFLLAQLSDGKSIKEMPIELCMV